MIDWNDLRFFIAVARDGSTLAAGKSLRTSQTTVARRIASLERAIGLPLFDRRQAGYALTPAGESLLSRAEAVEQAAGGFTDAAGALGRSVSGTVKVTTEEVYAITLLMPLLAELRERHPEIIIDLDTSSTVRDLGAGEADISLRATKSSSNTQAGLVGRMLCADNWGMYCSRDYAARHGVPANRDEMANHAIIGGGGGNLWLQYQAWLRSLGLEDQVAMHHATSGGLLSGVRSGFGIAALPCIVGDLDPDLIRCLRPTSEGERKLWLFTHQRVRHTPSVRTVVDFLYERLKQKAAQLEVGPVAAGVADAA